MSNTGLPPSKSVVSVSVSDGLDGEGGRRFRLSGITEEAEFFTVGRVVASFLQLTRFWRTTESPSTSAVINITKGDLPPSSPSGAGVPLERSLTGASVTLETGPTGSGLAGLSKVPGKLVNYKMHCRHTASCLDNTLTRDRS